MTSPARTPAWIAAPMPTTSSGLTPLCGSLPLNIALTASTTAGIRVIPPTRMTSSMSPAFSPASLSAASTGLRVFSTRSRTRSSSLARDRVTTRCFGPDASAVMYGRLISVEEVELSSILAFSAASLSRWSAWGSLERSIPWSFLNSASSHSMTRWSKSSPPRWVSPFVGLDLEDALAELEDRDVERAAAEVVDGDLLVVLLVEAVGERRRGRLVDDPADLEAGDPAGVLGRLALGVVEVGRDGDDRLGDLVAEIRFRVRLQLLEDHRADLGRAVGLVADLDDDAVGLGVLLDRVADELLGPLRLRVVPAAAHEALDRVDRVLRGS